MGTARSGQDPSARWTRTAVARGPIALVAVVALVLAACGGGDDSASGEPAEVTATAAPDDGDTGLDGEAMADEIVGDALDLELGNEEDPSDPDAPRALEVDVDSVTGFEAFGLAADGTTIWMTDMDNDVIRSFDVTTGEVGDDIAVGADPVGIAADGDEVWVANSNAGDHTVMRVDGSTGEVVATVETEAGTTPTGVALSDDSVWVALTGRGALAQIDRATNELVAVVSDDDASSPGVVDVLATDDAIWTIDRFCGRVLRIDPTAREIVETYDDLGYEASEPQTCTGSVSAQGPVRLAELDGAVFVLAEVGDGGDRAGRVYRIDPATGALDTVVDLEFSPLIARRLGVPAFVVEDTGIWLSAGDRSVRITRESGRPDGAFATGSFSATVVALVETDEGVWHAVAGDESVAGMHGVDKAQAAAAAA